MLRTLPVAALLGLVLAPTPASAQAPPDTAPRLLLIVMPEAEARTLFVERGARGLGVYPPSRDPADFIAELGTGAPPSSPERDPGVVARAIPQRRGFVADGMDGSVEATVLDALDLTRVEDVTDEPGLTVVVTATALDAQAAMAIVPARTIVIGIGERTPVLVGDPLWGGAIEGPRGILAYGQTRRDGLVTPYDVATMLLLPFGEPQLSTGRGWYVQPPLIDLDALASRLERDERDAVPSTSAASGGDMALLVLAVLLFWRHVDRGAAAVARAAAVVPLAHVLSQPLSLSWGARAALLLVAAAAAGAFPARDTSRFAGVALIASAVTIMAYAVIAAGQPSGPVAEGVWGNPLTSWRFFGLENHLAALAATGVLVGPALAGLPLVATVVGTVALGAVLGSGFLGANFVGVFTLGIGVTIIVLAARAGAVRGWHVIAGGVVGAIGTVLALIADTGQGASHGGRALTEVRSSGLGAAWSIIRERARLNVEELAAIGPHGYLAAVLLTAALVALVVWALRTNGSTVIGQAVAATSIAALVALVVEDSGFYTAGAMALGPWLAYLGVELGARLTPPADPRLSAAVSR